MNHLLTFNSFSTIYFFLKSGGYKLSALEIEREILAHPQVTETAVFGVDDPIMGEKVVAVIVCRNSINHHKEKLDDIEKELREFLKTRLSLYKQPRIIHFMVEGIPRNHLGKVCHHFIFLFHSFIHIIFVLIKLLLIILCIYTNF